MIRNKIKVTFFVEDGCSQKDNESSSHWKPLNFEIYSDVFVGIIKIAIDEWLSNNIIEKDVVYEVIFAHVIDRDLGGAVLDEHFEPIYTETQTN